MVARSCQLTDTDTNPQGSASGSWSIILFGNDYPEVMLEYQLRSHKSNSQGGLGLFYGFERSSIEERSSVGLNFKPACHNGRFHPEKAPAFAPRCRGGGGRCSLCLPWLPGRARVCKLWGLPVPRCCLGPSRSVLSCTSPVQGGSRAFLANATEVDCRTWPMGEAK